MEKINILDKMVTIVTEQGSVLMKEKKVGKRHNEMIVQLLSSLNFPVSDTMSDIALYEMVSKNNALMFLNYGREKINGEDKWTFYIVSPENLSTSQKEVIEDYIKMKDSFIQATNIFKYNSSKKHLEDLHYEQKLVYGIDELENLIKKENHDQKQV